jgi:hypothetical protein
MCMKAITIAMAAGVLIIGCTGSTPVAGAKSSPTSTITVSPAVQSPTPSPSPEVSPLPSPNPPPTGSPVPRQVLAPAKAMPAVDLCSADLVQTANGNVYPLLCQGGAVNVPAWKFYVQVSSNVLSLGRDATLDQVRAALCADQSQYHATYVEESSAYELAAAYYGWNFTPEPNCR